MSSCRWLSAFLRPSFTDVSTLEKLSVSFWSCCDHAWVTLSPAEETFWLAASALAVNPVQKPSLAEPPNAYTETGRLASPKAATMLAATKLYAASRRLKAVFIDSPSYIVSGAAVATGSLLVLL